MLERHFAQLAGKRWSGFAAPLRAALEAEAEEDEARTQRLTVPFKEASLTHGGEEDVWRLKGVGVDALRALAWQLESAECIVTMLRCPLYVADARTAFLDLSLVNREPWAWPNREGYEHTKAFEWEQLLWPRTMPVLSLPDWSCVELKHLNEDEFDHWSSEDFDTSSRTHRKRREWEVFRALVDDAEPPLGVQRIDTPDDRHVIDYVRAEWIPKNEDELRRLQRNALVRIAITKTVDRARSVVRQRAGGRGESVATPSAT